MRTRIITVTFLVSVLLGWFFFVFFFLWNSYFFVIFLGFLFSCFVLEFYLLNVFVCLLFVCFLFVSSLRRCVCLFVCMYVCMHAYASFRSYLSHSLSLHCTSLHTSLSRHFSSLRLTVPFRSIPSLTLVVYFSSPLFFSLCFLFRNNQVIHYQARYLMPRLHPDQ